jgi:hypothetical protein
LKSPDPEKQKKTNASHFIFAGFYRLAAICGPAGRDGRRNEVSAEALCNERTSGMKTLTSIAALGAALMMTHPASAASMLAKTCAADVKAQCGDVKPGGGKLKDCVKAHFSDLSADCQVAIVRAAAVGRACKADVKKLCADVKPGKGPIADCMKEHAADISAGCKDAMAKAEAGSR